MTDANTTEAASVGRITLASMFMDHNHLDQ